MKFRYLFYLLLICVSCGRSKPAMIADTDTVQPEVFAEDTFVYYPIKNNLIKVDLNNLQKASISDYFSHIELIPLETNDESVMNNVDKVVCYGERIYTLDYLQKVIHIFDDTGKFIFKINKYGQGPEEYLMVQDFIINPITGNLDLLSPFGFIHSYDLSGNHVKTSKRITNDELLAIHAQIPLDEKTNIFINKYGTSIVYYYDMDEMKILFHTYEDPNRIIFSPNIYNYNGKWFLYAAYDNIVYELGADYELGTDAVVESYTLDFDKYNYKLTEKIFSSDMSEFSSREEYIAKRQEVLDKIPYRIRRQDQNNRYVMANIKIKNDEDAFLIYDKSTQESKLMKHFNESVGFQPYLVTNEYVLAYCPYGALDQYVNETMLDESNQQKFNTLVNTKGEELNPVLIKYYFK